MQTEDKGLETPLMLTLVYTRGEILASKRVRYDDLIAAGFDEQILAERLLRQHKLICAAIRSGRLEELKKMTERENASRAPSKKKTQPDSPPPVLEATPAIIPVVELNNEVIVTTPSPPPRSRQRLPAPPQRSSRVSPVAEPDTVSVPAPASPLVGASMHLVLVDEKNYRGGDRVMLRVRVESGGKQKQVISGAEVIVKILGSTFRPLIYQSQSGNDGIAFFRTELPHFRSGRAAILIRATAGGVEAELRRIIQQG